MIPTEVVLELEDYLRGEHPYPFGSFLTAVLANDFVEAAARADASNTRILAEYAAYLRGNMPARTGDPAVDWWGSYEAVRRRIAESKERTR